MTNREWMQSMNTDRFAEFIARFEYCKYCKACDGERTVSSCKSAFKAWLEAEHIETQISQGINILVKGNKVIAKRGNKVGIARCSPEDEFNIFTGARIALDKLEETSNCYSWLKKGMKYYFPAPWKRSLVDSFMYDGGVTDEWYISCGLVFRTEGEAIEATKKMLAALKEG